LSGEASSAGVERSGALLVNLGTPDSPSVVDVRRYLREFLSDPRVLDMPAVLRWLFLRTVILPSRPKRSAAAYAKIWMPEGSPLWVHTRDLGKEVAALLGERWEVSIGMRYGSPSIRSAVEQLAEANISRLVVIPLFPQFSEAATGSAIAEIEEQLRRARLDVPTHTVRSFCDEPGFIGSVAELMRDAVDSFEPDYVLFSYHGLPERQIRSGDATAAHCLETPGCCEVVDRPVAECYRAQCFATTRALASTLQLDAGKYGNSFQSRLGRTPWIQPFTDVVFGQLAARGIRRLLVVCPSFTADCLETLEEIGIRGREQWRGLGGDDLLAVPAPNATATWSGAVADLIRSNPL
jgi:ferrochelatase